MKKFLLSFLAIIMGGLMVATPAFAVCPEGCVPTSVLGNTTGTEGESCNCPDQQDGGIEGILDIVVNVMTIGVGILGVVGISIVGVQYLTAGGNEEQTRKAKRRLLEIVIGLAAYAILYAALKWLRII